MKKITIILFSLFASFFVSAQEVVATQGSSYTNGDVSMDFTIGEVIINTESSVNTDVTQGFHQTTWIITSVDSYYSKYEATVFPNPTVDQLNIQTSEFEDVMYTLYDVKGGVVRKGILTAGKTSIQLSELASGSYSIVLSNNTQDLKIFKVVKTQ